MGLKNDIKYEFEDDKFCIDEKQMFFVSRTVLPSFVYFCCNYYYIYCTSMYLLYASKSLNFDNKLCHCNYPAAINETPVLALHYISLLMWRVLLMVKYVLTMLNIGLTKNNAE